MKKNICIIIVVLMSFVQTFAQGIDFQYKSWSEAVALAQKENKLVMAEFSTTWCGWCKKMAKDVFTQKEVGDIFNAKTINISLDGEKGEGPDIVSKYGITAYPTLLFVNSKGELIYKIVGYRTSTDLIDETHKALASFETAKPLSEWDNEYANSKTDTAFLFDYISKRTDVQLDNSKLLEEYLSLLPSGRQSVDKNLILIANNIANIKLGSIAYRVLSGHFQHLSELLTPSAFEALQRPYLQIPSNTFWYAVKEKNETLIPLAIQKFSENPFMYQFDNEHNTWMSYYLYTRDTANYLDRASQYFDLISLNSIQSKANQYITFLFKSGQKVPANNDSILYVNKLKQLFVDVKRQDIVTIIESAINIAFQQKKYTEKLLEWANKALSLNASAFDTSEVYSILLYRNGDVRNAVKQLDFVSKNIDKLIVSTKDNKAWLKAKQTNLADIRRKMKKGQNV
jgi:thioredoxin-related protein